jgi:hypothetical protein
MKRAAIASLFAGSVAWFAWLLWSSAMQPRCAPSLVQDPACWSGTQRFAAALLIGALALLFGVLVSSTFVLALATPADGSRPRAFRLSRAVAVLAACAMGALLLWDASAQQQRPVPGAVVAVVWIAAVLNADQARRPRSRAHPSR